MRASLPATTVENIRSLIAAGESDTAISLVLSVSRTTVNKIRHGRRHSAARALTEQLVEANALLDQIASVLSHHSQRSFNYLRSRPASLLTEINDLVEANFLMQLQAAASRIRAHPVKLSPDERALLISDYIKTLTTSGDLHPSPSPITLSPQGDPP